MLHGRARAARAVAHRLRGSVGTASTGRSGTRGAGTLLAPPLRPAVPCTAGARCDECRDVNGAGDRGGQAPVRQMPSRTKLLTTFSKPLADALAVRLRRLVSNEPRL